VINPALGLGIAVTFPVGSGAKPRPLLILVQFEPRSDASPWRRSQLCATKKIQKKISRPFRGRGPNAAASIAKHPP